MTEVPAFFNLYRHNFARLAVAVPPVRVADPAVNARETIALMQEADARHALVTLFPELGLSGYACDDLFHQQALLEACVLLPESSPPPPPAPPESLGRRRVARFTPSPDVA